MFIYSILGDIMKNNTGFYRVTQTSYSYKTSNGIKKKIRWKYKVDNELMKKEITSNNLLKLKIKVLEANLDWGITNMEKAIKTAQISRCNIKDLEGQYGKKIDKT